MKGEHKGGQKVTNSQMNLGGNPGGRRGWVLEKGKAEEMRCSHKREKESKERRKKKKERGERKKRKEGPLVCFFSSLLTREFVLCH